jgi:hypothetical protein
VFGKVEVVVASCGKDAILLHERYSLPAIRAFPTIKSREFGYELGQQLEEHLQCYIYLPSSKLSFQAMQGVAA